jgi:uncharacterized membrane protein YphA (DoxX/SURF4 family)
MRIAEQVLRININVTCFLEDSLFFPAILDFNFDISKTKMQLVNNFKAPSMILRIAIAVPYLWFVSDRMGLLGAYGQAHVGWGDWKHFLEYAQKTMRFLPASVVPIFGVAATICEFTFGSLLLCGLFTRFAAVGSGILSFLFGVSMAVSFGIESPLGYSVFTVSAASFLLATIPEYKWSLDHLLERNKQEQYPD